MNDPISTQQVPPIPLVPAEMLHALTVAHAEIARLRLTDSEKKAVKSALGWCDDRDTETIATLRGLLERTE